MQCIASALAVMQRVIDANQGRVVKTIGDEVMAVFNTADDALRASFEIQWQVNELPPLGGEQIAVRVGFHYGPALDCDGDVFGDSVNLAARLVGQDPRLGLALLRAELPATTDPSATGTTRGTARSLR